MTLLFVDGFDNYASGNTQDFTTRGWNTNAPIIPGLKHGNATYGGIYIMGSKMVGYNYYPNSLAYTDDVPRSGIFGFWFKTRSGDASERRIAGLLESSQTTYVSPSIAINLGRLGIGIGTSTVYYSDFYIGWDKWYHLEMKYQWSTSTTMVNELRVNGVTILTLPLGMATYVLSTYLPRYFYLLENSTYYIYDHFYLMDVYGDSFNDFIGPFVYVKDVYPTGAGETTAWTPNGSGTNVASVWQSAPDEDVSVVSTTTSGNVDTYRFPVFTGGLSDEFNVKNILAITSNVVARKGGTWNTRLRDVVRAGGTNYYDIIDTGTLGLGFSTYQTIYQNDPSTSLPWTTGSIRDREFGFELWNTGVL